MDYHHLIKSHLKYLNINCWSNEKDTEGAQFGDDILVDRGYCSLVLVQDQRYSRADEDTNQKYCDVQYVVHPSDRAQLGPHPSCSLKNI